MREVKTLRFECPHCKSELEAEKDKDGKITINVRKIGDGVKTKVKSKSFIEDFFGGGDDDDEGGGGDDDDKE